MHRYINKKEEKNNSNKNRNRYTPITIVDNRPESKKLAQLKEDINNRTAPIQRVMYVGYNSYNDINSIKYKIRKFIGETVPKELDDYITDAIGNGKEFRNLEVLTTDLIMEYLNLVIKNTFPSVNYDIVTQITSIIKNENKLPLTFQSVHDTVLNDQGKKHENINQLKNELILKYLKQSIKKIIPSVHDNTISYIIDIIKEKNKLPSTFRSIEDIVLDNKNLFGENFNNILFNNSVYTEMSLHKFLIECTNSDNNKIYNEISYKKEDKSKLSFSENDIKKLKDLILEIKPKIKLMSQKTGIEVNKKDPVRDSLPNEDEKKYSYYLFKLCYDYYHVVKSEDDTVKARIALNINPDYYKAESINKIIDLCNKYECVQGSKFTSPKHGSIKIDNFIIYLKSSLDEEKHIKSLIGELNDLNREYKYKLLNKELPYTMKVMEAVGYGEEPHNKALSYGAKRSVIAKLALEQANTFDDYLTNAYLISEMAGIDIIEPHKDSGIKSDPLLKKFLTLNNCLHTLKSKKIPYKS